MKKMLFMFARSQSIKLAVTIFSRLDELCWTLVVLLNSSVLTRIDGSGSGRSGRLLLALAVEKPLAAGSFE